VTTGEPGRPRREGSASSLKNARAELLADVSLQGADFGAALADVLDRRLRELFEQDDPRAPVALVAFGSYARRELCPGSDVDLVLLHAAKSRQRGAVRELAERFWYELWDAGLVTGHGIRTIRESIALADEDLDALTSLQDARHILGSPSLTEELERRGRELLQRRSKRVLRQLAAAAELRRLRPGLVAEMLEPDVKEGAGGLRDIQSFAWAGNALGADGLAGLEQRGFVTAPDAQRLQAARRHLLRVRVALHRATNGRTDRLALQEQEAVAELVGAPNADTMVRELSSYARDVAWVSQEAWGRVRDHLAGPSGRLASSDRVLAEGVVLRDGRVVVEADQSITTLRVLEAAVAAAEHDAPFERRTLGALSAMPDPTWDVWERAAFLRLLRTGTGAIPVFEALDHEGVLVRLLPEWEHVRSRPQRNAYHRYTVDRHLLQAVAECASLLAEGDAAEPGFDGVVARACRRPELLLMGALLHDIGKGRPGDHSDVGAQIASEVVRRLGFDSEGREIVTWLVRRHLVMADVATRRDLSDASVADSIAIECAGDAERLRLLYLLTIGDSRATGPAAWGVTKAALLRDLFVKAAAAIERGKATAIADDRRDALVDRIGADRAAALLDRLPTAYLLAFGVDDALEHEALLASRAAVRCRREHGRTTVTVVARDRPGLLATLAGALTVCGLDVVEANLFGTNDGLALDVFTVSDPFGRLTEGVSDVERTLQEALDGTLDVGKRVAERSRDYRRRPSQPRPLEIEVVVGESGTDTLVEVHADDEIGLLYRMADVLASLGLDVRVAKVATLGERVVDVFYVRGAGHKVADDESVERLRAALAASLSD
jgi:[protein-PII] uridylyltransferase